MSWLQKTKKFRMSRLQKLKSFGLIGSYVVVSFANFIANSFTAGVLSRFWNMSNMVASRDVKVEL